MSGRSVGWRKRSINIAPLLQRGVAFRKGIELATSVSDGMHVSSVENARDFLC